MDNEIRYKYIMEYYSNKNRNLQVNGKTEKKNTLVEIIQTKEDKCYMFLLIWDY